MGEILNLEDAAIWSRNMQASGKKLVVTNGAFDLLHRGHVEYLTAAANEGDCLLVAMNSDASVRTLKGPERPVVCQEDRAYLLAALNCVSAVTMFDAPKAVEVFKVIHPDVYVKGGDYTEDTLDKEEHDLLAAGGARFVFIPFVQGHSTSSVIKQIRAGQTGPVGDRRIDGILSRHSVRKYQLRPVGNDLIAEILKAGRAAPSARRCYPWDCIVVRGEQLKALAECLPNGAFLKDASAGIIVCGRQADACGAELSYLIQDCAAATENMLLAINMLGLGGCWLGIHPRTERITKIRALFSLPDNLTPISAISLGWPGE